MDEQRAETKTCKGCHAQKSVSDYFSFIDKSNGRRYYFSRCKPCQIIWQRERRQAERIVRRAVAEYGAGQQVAIACAGCATRFFVAFGHDHRKYCSAACYYRRKNGHITIACVVCGTTFSVQPSHHHLRTCSPECASTNRSEGQRKNPTTPRTRCKYQSWRKVRQQVIDRDGNACVTCGTSKQLSAHHMTPWRVSHDDSLTNLVTLCRSCHMKLEWRDHRGRICTE